MCAAIGEHWASRAYAHKYLGLWKVNGLLERVLVTLQEICVEAKAIDLTRPAVGGFFSIRKGGGEGVDYGYKGKGVTSRFILDGLGQPLAVASTGARGDERKEAAPLLKNQRQVKTSSFPGGIPILEADKGYDLKELRLQILNLKIFPIAGWGKTN